MGHYQDTESRDAQVPELPEKVPATIVEVQGFVCSVKNDKKSDESVFGI